MHIDPCEDHPGWCEATQDRLQVGDRLICVGGLTYEDYRKDRRCIPFDGYGPGQNVPITFQRNGHKHMILWQMPTISAAYRAPNLSGLLFYLPFWLAGTVVLLFLRPRDQRWWLLISCNYLAAAWLATGMASQSHVAASSLMLHALTWLFALAIVHLHLLVPTSLLGGRFRRFLLFFYAGAAIFALLEFLQFLPHSAYLLGLLLAILGSLGLMVFRLFKKLSPSVQLTTRLMLAGIGLALGPGFALWLIPELLGLPAPGVLATGVALFAVPVLPFTYTYAIYKRNLGPLEFRANRLISLYAFILLYGTVLVLIFLIGSLWLDLPIHSLILLLVVSVAIAIAMPPLRAWFQRLVNRLVYGTEHDPDDIIRTFANKIPAILDFKTLAHLLSKKLLPSLLIRQSALSLLVDGNPKIVYASGVSLSETPKTLRQVRELLVGAGYYRPAPSSVQDGYPDQHRFEWVRLVIPLEVRKKPTGVWLFGQRDPDDYYSQDDIRLLTILASQVSVTIANTQLYEQAQREIAERKRVEEELKKHRGCLQKLVEERTSELTKTNRQLQQEIAEHRLLQEVLRESEKRFSDIAANSLEWIWEVDANGKYTYASPVVKRILGYKPEEVLKKHFYDLFHDEDRERLKKAAIEMFARKQPFREFINRNVHKNGTTVWLSTSGVPILDAEGNLLGYRGADVDITERKRAEEQLRQYSEQLEELVEKRTDRIRQLERERMEHKRLAAQGRMAARVAHEINNPLGGIKNSFQLIKDAIPEDHTYYRYVDLIEKEIDRITYIVRKMFDLYRPDQDRPIEFSVKDDIDDVIILLKPNLRESGVSVEIDTRDVPEAVTLPEASFRQVLYNLLLNAIEASQPEGVVRIEARVADEILTITISDEGSGIPEKIQSHIFEPFFTTKKGLESAGLGLGLPISRSLVEAMRGSLDFESKAGQGTLFRITLPLGGKRRKHRKGRGDRGQLPPRKS